MTAEPDLLPLPEPLLVRGDIGGLYTGRECQHYARANLAPLQAENERLRVEVELWRHKAAVHKYRRKRLVEALMEYGLPLTGDDIQDAWEFGDETVAREKRRRAALAQEDRNG